MVDFIVNTFAEIADFFITLWVDKVVDRCAQKRKRRQGSFSEKDEKEI